MKNKLLLLFSLLIIINTPVYSQNSYEITISRNVNISKAETYLKEGNYDKALEVYNSILSTEPNSIPARIGLAKAYSELFKLKAAQREFSKVLSQDPNNSDAHNGLGLTYYYQTTSSNMDIRENTGEHGLP